MANQKRVIEMQGATVEQAIKAGLDKLGVERSQVLVEIVDEGSRGLLGIGRRDAVVQLTDMSEVLEPLAEEEEREEAPSEPEPATARVAKPERKPERPVTSQKAEKAEPAKDVAPSRSKKKKKPKPKPTPQPAPTAEKEEPAEYEIITEEEDALLRAEDESVPASRSRVTSISVEMLPESQQAEVASALELMKHLLELMEVDAGIELALSEEDDLTEQRIPIVQVVGDDLGPLIGPRGRTLNDVQFVLRAMVSQQIKGRTSFLLDIGGYREKRIETLAELAERTAEKVARSGRAVTLDPMPPHERRIIHMTLRNDNRVLTKSSGEGRRRRVRVLKKRNNRSRRRRNRD